MTDTEIASSGSAEGAGKAGCWPAPTPCPIWVKRSGIGAFGPFPVHLEQRTSSDRPSSSRWCRQAKGKKASYGRNLGCRIRNQSILRAASLRADQTAGHRRIGQGNLSSAYPLSLRMRRRLPGLFRAPECDARGPGNQVRHAGPPKRTPDSSRFRDWGSLQ